MAGVDFNSDLGESLGLWERGADDAMMQVISSANVACGFHAGDPGGMRETLAKAQRHRVAVGAHPGLPDLLGFGRRRMDVSPRDVRDYVLYQIGALSAFAHALGLRLHHIKPHGALYVMALDDPVVAAAVAEAVTEVDPSLPVYTLAGGSPRWPAERWLRRPSAWACVPCPSSSLTVRWPATAPWSCSTGATGSTPARRRSRNVYAASSLPAASRPTTALSWPSQPKASVFTRTLRTRRR